MCESKSAVWLLGELSTAASWYLLMIDHWWRGIGDWCFFGDWYNSWLAVGKDVEAVTTVIKLLFHGPQGGVCRQRQSIQLNFSGPICRMRVLGGMDRAWIGLPVYPTASAGHGSALQLWRDLDIVQFNVREQTEASGSLWHQRKVDEFQPGHMISFYSYGIFETCH